MLHETEESPNYKYRWLQTQKRFKILLYLEFEYRKSRTIKGDTMLKLICATKCSNNHKHPQIHNQDSLHFTITLAVLHGASSGSPDPLVVGSDLPDPLVVGSVSPDPKVAGSSSPNPLIMGSVSPDPKVAGSGSPDPLVVGFVSPDPKVVGSGSPNRLVASSSCSTSWGIVC